MRKACFLVFVVALLLVPIASSQTATAASADVVALPAPSTTGGMALSEALATRRSVRSFTNVVLTQQELSQLFWAAQGVTDAKGHRTAPSAMAKYFLTVYVATPNGLFQYSPDGHKLKKLSADDLRAKLSSQQAVSSAPAVFIIAGDYDRAKQSLNAEFGARSVDLEAGHATQNLLLQATALHLAGVPAGGANPDDVSKAASLPSSSRPIYLVPIGHAK